MPGGIANFLSGLCNELSRRGHKIYVQVNKMPGSEIFDVNQPYKIIRYDLPKRLCSLVIGGYLIKQCIRKRPDIIFLGHVFGTRGFFALLVHWCFRIPYVILIHGGHLPLARVSKTNKIAVFSLLNSAELLIANSQYTSNLLLEKGFSKNKIRILNPGVDTDYFFPLEDKKEIEKIKKQYCQVHTILIVNVARLVPKKNHIKLIEALSEIMKNKKQVKGIIAGDGPERERLEELIASKGLFNEIILIGNVDHMQVRDLMRAADIVALPSILINGHHESFGIVAMEAASCNKPVIVGSKGGQADTVIHGKTGLIVDAENAFEIAKAINGLIENLHMAKQLGVAGRKRVVEKFAWAKSAEKAEKIFQGLMSKST